MPVLSSGFEAELLCPTSSVDVGFSAVMKLLALVASD